MVKKFAKFMKYGKIVESSWTGSKFKLIEDMDEGKDFVRVVPVAKWDRYHTVKVWLENWETNKWSFRERFTWKDVNEWKTEMQGIEDELKISDIKPANFVRFITPEYKDKFKVRDLSLVVVDGKARRVVYLDEAHFTFMDGDGMNLYGGCYHICQYAELCKQNNIEVKPVA